MIEIIQQTAKTEENLESRLPKNIRQIGNPEKDFRIYMEDYVYTYLHPAQIHGMEMGFLPRLLILLGEINHFSNRSCAFISGAIQVENSEQPEVLPSLDEATWRKVHQEMQRFFDKCEIVGWVLDIPGNTLEISREMEETHRRNFISKYQFFFLMDSKEREEAFYTWKDGRLSRKEGYFIYYEKNPQMQEYMISRRESMYGEEETPTEEVPDRAARNYRAMMMRKKENAGKARTGILSYLTSVFSVVVLCSVSVLLLGSIRRMENMEQTISVMSNAIEFVGEEKENEENKVSVETISGNVIPIEEELPEQEQNAAANEEEPLEQEQNAAANEEELSEQEQKDTANEPPQDTAPAEETEASAGGQDGQNPDSLQVQKEEEPSQPAATPAETYLAQGYYIVQKGDSLRQICYGIYQTHSMMKKLCEANNIEDENTIYVGQKIILP